MRVSAARASTAGPAMYLALLILLGAVGCATPSPSPSPEDFDPTVYLGPGGRVFWVAGEDPAASDANPGSPWQPWKTIGRATATLQAGDVVVIRAGTYRETVAPPRGGTAETSRITYVGDPGEPVVLSGADVQTGWIQEGTLWWVPFTLSLPVGDDVLAAWEFRDPVFYTLDKMRRQQVIEDGVPLRQVEQKTQLTPGTFWVAGTDNAPTRLYIRTREDDAPSQHVMEVGMRSVLFNPAGGVQWLRVKNLTFRYGTNHYHQSPPALWLGAANGLMEDVVAEWINMQGITVNGSNHVFRRVTAQNMGQIGWSGSCNGCLIEDSKALRNNWKRHNPNIESGGTKFAFSRNITLRRFESAYNFGDGIWFDISNYDNVVEDSLVYHNTNIGIFMELNTDRTIVRNNVVFGTGKFILTDGSGINGHGINVQGAKDNVIVHNTVIGNAGVGISMGFPDPRTATTGNRVYNNLALDNAAGYSTFGTAVAGYGGNLCWPGNCGPMVSTVADPLLANKADVKGYHLTASSPARGKGVPPAVAVPGDIDGQTRPSTGADLGVDRHNLVESPLEAPAGCRPEGADGGG